MKLTPLKRKLLIDLAKPHATEAVMLVTDLMAHIDNFEQRVDDIQKEVDSIINVRLALKDAPMHMGGS